MQQESSRLQTRKRALFRNPNRLHLDLGLSRLRSCQKINLCCLSHTVYGTPLWQPELILTEIILKGEAASSPSAFIFCRKQKTLQDPCQKGNIPSASVVYKLESRKIKYTHLSYFVLVWYIKFTCLYDTYNFVIQSEQNQHVGWETERKENILWAGAKTLQRLHGV